MTNVATDPIKELTYMLSIGTETLNDLGRPLGLCTMTILHYRPTTVYGAQRTDLNEATFIPSAATCR